MPRLWRLRISPVDRLAADPVETNSAALAAAALVLCALAAAPPSALAASPGPDVAVRLVVPDRAAAGTTVPVIVEMRIGRGFHVNGHTPTHDYLIPTTVTLSASAGSLSAVRYPAAVERRLQFDDDPLAVYEGRVRFPAELVLPRAATGEVSLEAVVGYQACNAQTCFPPAKEKVSAALAVKPDPKE